MPCTQEAYRNASPITSVIFFDNSFLKARYIKPSVENVEKIVKKYKSIPGGITLEGTADNLPIINDINYIPGKNIFIINGELIYQNVLTPFEIKDIFNAIGKDDIIGVSLGEKNLIYGKLKDGSIASILMKLSDHFLGCIVFACNDWINFSDFPKGYQPKTDKETDGMYAIYFNFNDFNFKIENKQILPFSAAMNITLVPLTDTQNSEGGYLPDYQRINNGSISKAFEANSIHIAENGDYYSKDQRLQRVIAYGQIAALARTLKQNGISLSKIII